MDAGTQLGLILRTVTPTWTQTHDHWGIQADLSRFCSLGGDWL